MATFCSSPLWNTSLTWSTSNPDFTSCFHHTVLIYVPCIPFLILLLPYALYLCKGSKERKVPNSLLTLIRNLLMGLAIVLSVVHLVLELNGGLEMGVTKVPLANLTSAFLLLFTLSISLWLSFHMRKHGLVTSSGQFYLWAMLSVSTLLTASSVIRFPFKYRVDEILFYIGLALTSLTLTILQCWPDKPPLYREIDSLNEVCPEVYASFVSKVTFSWIGKMIFKGFKTPLTEKDLYELPFEDSSADINPRWKRNWANLEEKKKKTDGKVNVASNLARTFGSMYSIGFLFAFLTVLQQQVTPNIMGLLISYISNGEPTWRGYFYAFLLVASNIGRSLLNSQSIRINMLMGARVRTALSSAVYSKALRMSASSKRNRTVGEAVNLMALDSERFSALATSLDVLWSAPLTITLSLISLWGQLGAASLAALAILLVTVPINVVLASITRKYQRSVMVSKDSRVKVMNELIDGIRVIKMYAWEPSFESKVRSLRASEVHKLSLTFLIFAVRSFVLTFASYSVAVASFAAFVLLDPSNVLTADKAFVSTSFFNIMRAPLIGLAGFITQLVQTYVSVERLNTFLNESEIEKKAIEQRKMETDAVLMQDAVFSWDKSNLKSATLDTPHIRLRKGTLTAVVGSVGSGKSSLLAALANDMEKVRGTVALDGRIAYAPQQPWIRNASLKFNIIFGLNTEESVYDRVLDACALKPDLDILEEGDQTEIGERGINLSGGQKQRVSLARCVYSNADVYLLDDPLSAVDAHVGKHIFEKVLSNDTGLLKNKTRLLVTNGVTHLPKMDHIIVMKEGRVAEQGSFTELMRRGGDFAAFLVSHMQEEEEEEDTDQEDQEQLREIKRQLETTMGKEAVKRSLSKVTKSEKSNISAYGAQLRPGRHQRRDQGDPSSRVSRQRARRAKRGGKTLTAEEKLETKSVDREVYIFYFRYIGFLVVALVMVSSVLTEVSSVGADTWLAKWTDDPKASQPAIRDTYLIVYGVLGLTASLLVMVGQGLVAVSGLRAAKKLHDSMLSNLLRTPMSFFDTNPLGRVVNRFAKDVDYVDSTVPMTLNSLLGSSIRIVSRLIVISLANPLILLVVAVLLVFYWYLQKLYVATSRQVRRLESITRSPVYSLFSETLSGLSTIRAFGLERKYEKENEDGIDLNQMCVHPSIISNRWLTFRLQVLGNVVIFTAALFSVMARGSIDAGLVGLTLTYANNLTPTLNAFLRQTSQIEASMVSVERVKEYVTALPNEAQLHTDFDPEDKSWPTKGQVLFKNYQTRYRPHLDLVLRGIDASVGAGEKIGIVGRTGAGKSSLTLALFRIIEASEGHISIDGLNIGQMGLRTLRSKLTIIPQDPVLFSGSLRFNLDPSHDFSDQQVWRALDHAHLMAFVSNLPEKLNFEVAEKGSNLSVGQKQLVCLARALLRKSKILVLDEATAAVDLETDDLIQSTIRTEFSECTIITIAHRLNTILDNDRVMVLDAGKVVEFDKPSVLLNNSQSIFAKMAANAGINSAAEPTSFAD